MSRALTVLRFGWKVVGSRAFGVFLGLLALVWAFDKAIWLVTERSFFASVGLESWFWRQTLAPLALFGVFFGVCLGLQGWFLRRVSTRKDEDAPQLRGILTRFGPLRARIGAVARVLALVFSLLLARDFARHGPEAMALFYGGRAGFGYLGLDASLWTRWLPILVPFALGIWKFALVLSFLAAICGVLRFLPAIAAQNSAPLALTQVLWRIAALLLMIRALLYALQTLDLPRGRPLETGDVLILAPLWMAGAAWCALLSAKFARRSLQKVATLAARGDVSRAVLTALAALFLPAFAGALSLPIRALLPETSALKTERERATRAAWRLGESESQADARAQNASIEQVWPVWDEAALLASRPTAGFAGRRVVAWKSATLDFGNGGWSALLAGESVGAMAWNSSREVDVSNALALERIDLSDSKTSQKLLESTPLPISDAFFGFEGRSLFAKRGGIELGSPFMKWAWAWRFRDLFLPVDAAANPHLLTFRGARERAGVLAPFLTVAGEPRLKLEGENTLWTLDLVALSANFPGAMRGPSGAWARANATSAPLQMRLDARSGAARFASFSGARDAFSDDLRAAFPGIAREGGNGGAGANLGRIQAEMRAALGETGGAILGPSRALNARGEVAWRVLTIRKNDFELLEGATPRPILRRGVGDLNARLGEIDAAIAQIRAPGGDLTDLNGESANAAANAANSTGNSGNDALDVRAGIPFAMRDARAPGGFWVGRAFFAAPRDSSPTLNPAPREDAPHGPLLWRVALTGIAPESRVGIGESAAQAVDFATKQQLRPETLSENRPATVPKTSASGAKPRPPLNSKPPLATNPGELLEEVALRTHQQMQAAAQRGDWEAFGTLGARETEILQTLAARRKNQPENSAP